MADKKLTLILYGADRQLWNSGKANLRVTRFDSNGKDALWVRGFGKRARKNIALEGAIIEINLDLAFDAGQVYCFHVTAPKHRRAFQIVSRDTFLRAEGDERIERSDTICRLMLVPRKPSSPDLDAGFDKLLSRGSPMVAPQTGISKETYQALKPAAKMALLNIEAKLKSTQVNGTELLSCVTGLRAVEVDRLYLMMSSELKDFVKHSPHFASAPGHKKPEDHPDLPGHPDSWKHTVYGVGNLQLSFSRSPRNWPAGGTSKSFSVDADIDLERGLKHLWEWLVNNVFKPGTKTDQTVVYGLLYDQGIIPSYTLNTI